MQVSTTPAISSTRALPTNRQSPPAAQEPQGLVDTVTLSTPHSTPSPAALAATGLHTAMAAAIAGGCAASCPTCGLICVKSPGHSNQTEDWRYHRCPNGHQWV